MTVGLRLRFFCCALSRQVQAADGVRAHSFKFASSLRSSSLWLSDLWARLPCLASGLTAGLGAPTLRGRSGRAAGWSTDAAAAHLG